MVVVLLLVVVVVLLVVVGLAESFDAAAANVPFVPVPRDR